MARSHTDRLPLVFGLMIVVAAVVAGLAPAMSAKSDARTNQHPYRGDRLVVAQEDAAQAPHQRPENAVGDHARGAVFKGLTGSRHCPGGFLISESNGTCTHGPDRAPRGRVQDVRDVPTTTELQSAAGTLEASGTSSTQGQIPCYGDGVSGSRVQMIYAVASDRADRYLSLLDTFPVYAARTNAVFANSAANYGETRNLRFVHTADCRLDVMHVVLTPAGDDTFSATISELQSLGLTRTDRKYLVWLDAGVYCGIGTVTSDESAGPSNRNNLGPSYGRVDAACWGAYNSVEAHEISHTLGAVQLGAPNSNGAWHCTDEYDRLCYNDGSGATMTFPCANAGEGILDCKGNDYFNPRPAQNSYLANHWNLADSAFLSAQAPGSSEPAPPPDPEPTPTTSPTTSPTSSPSPTATATTTSFSGSLNKKQNVRDFAISVAAGSLVADMTTSKGKSMRVSLLDASGAAITSGSGTAVRIQVNELPRGNYTLRVDNGDSGSFTVKATYGS